MRGTITLTLAEGTQDERRFVFDGPACVLVGRDADCDIRLPNEFIYGDVSRHHCLFEIDPPHVRVRDLGSRNGTFVNDTNIGQRARKVPVEFAHPAAEAVELDHDDAVRVGITFFRVLVDASEDAMSWHREMSHSA
jgi:pSer/pThr/pTyr-binding forkhead associated (FHA) protein